MWCDVSTRRGSCQDWCVKKFIRSSELMLLIMMCKKSWSCWCDVIDSMWRDVMWSRLKSCVDGFIKKSLMSMIMMCWCVRCVMSCKKFMMCRCIKIYDDGCWCWSWSDVDEVVDEIDVLIKSFMLMRLCDACWCDVIDRHDVMWELMYDVLTRSWWVV